jgi:RNA polymerase sigma-70 factor (ECF subfamily)
MQNKDESELIAHSLNGNHTAYEVLVNRYKNAIFYHCFAILRDEDQAEDIAQETFITAYYKLRTYNPAYKLSTWLFKIATNKSLNLLKKNKRVIRGEDTMFDQIASHHPGPETQAEYTELHNAVNKLQTKHRVAVSLYYWQGLNYQEIAQVMASPVGSVRGWLNRAKHTLRKELS